MLGSVGYESQSARRCHEPHLRSDTPLKVEVDKNWSSPWQVSLHREQGGVGSSSDLTGQSHDPPDRFVRSSLMSGFPSSGRPVWRAMGGPCAPTARPRRRETQNCCCRWFTRARCWSTWFLSRSAPCPQLRSQLAQAPGVAQVDPPQVAPGGHTAVFTVVPTSSPDDASTEALVHELRDTVFPASPGSPQAHVGGATTTSIDLANQLGPRMGWFMRVVVGLAFLLLLVEFRALLVPAMAVGLNLLAVGAAYGPVVAVFQWDWGHLSLLGSEPGPIESFAPVMLFAVLFGLSTDYAIFLLSRVREGFQHTGDVRRAMREGIAPTGRVILAGHRSSRSAHANAKTPARHCG